MERGCERANLNRAYKRVKANKGAAGVDGMTVHDLYDWLAKHKEKLIASLLNGTYQRPPLDCIKVFDHQIDDARCGCPSVSSQQSYSLAPVLLRIHLRHRQNRGFSTTST